MNTYTTITYTPAELIAAWRETLPHILDEGDSVVIQLDEANSSRLLIHIDVAGHSGYSFDFSCRYVDDREVEAEPSQTYGKKFAIECGMGWNLNQSDYLVKGYVDEVRIKYR